MTSSQPFFNALFLRKGIKMFTESHNLIWLCKMNMMQTSISSTPLTKEFATRNWLEFIPQTSPGIYYSPRYLIPQFLPECIMINVLVHRCCEAQINLCRESSRGAIMQQRLYVSPLLHRLLTPQQRISRTAITNSCVAGRGIPCSKNQSKNIHDYSPEDGVYGQTVNRITE